MAKKRERDGGLFTRAEAALGASHEVEETRVSLEVLHKQECKACPLNKARVNNGKMEPTGSKKPLIYVLGEAPGETEDIKGEQFVGKAGKLLREQIPRSWLESFRFNNVIRTRPPKNRTPDWIEVECCRPSIVRDIEATKPKAIFGFGGIPLSWATGLSGITAWRGRRMPVRVGSHECWYYPMLHPSFVLRTENERGEDRKGAEWARVFKRDFVRALGEVEDLPTPEVEDPSKVLEGVLVLQNDPAEVIHYLGEAAKEPLTAIDIETTEVRAYHKDSKILSAAIAFGSNTFAFLFDHPFAKDSNNRHPGIRKAFDAYLRSPGRKVAQSTRFEMEWLVQEFGEDCIRLSEWEDTRAQAYVLDERSGNETQALNGLCVLHFGFAVKDAVKVNHKRLAYERVDRLLAYNGIDSKYELKLFLRQQALLRDQKLQHVYEIQKRRIPSTAMATHSGFPVDQIEVGSWKDKLDEEEKPILEKIMADPAVKAFQKRFGPFNPTSTSDVGKLYDEILDREEVRKENGRVSTDKSILDGLKDIHLTKPLLDLRRVAKLRSTYIDPLILGGPNSVVFPDGMIHPIFNTTVTETGRLASEDPNAQNWPKRQNVEIRSTFRAPKGCVIVAADYGQIEARVIAMFSKDKKLCESLWKDWDIHLFWAEKLVKACPEFYRRFDRDIKKVRHEAKNKIVFPRFYGAVPASMARNLDVDEGILVEFCEEFDEMHEGVIEWQRQLIKSYNARGYVECLTGRRRRAPLTKNMIINSPVQGSASDIVVGAMDTLSERSWREEDPDIRPRLNIHDDLTFICREEGVEDAMAKIVRTMLTVEYDWVNVPISVEIAVGKDWAHMDKVGDFFSHHDLPEGASNH